MFVALVTLATAHAVEMPPCDYDERPVTLHNAGRELGVLSTLSPLPGEEGQWTAVRFEATRDLSLQSIDATFVREPSSGGASPECVVDVAHDVVVFTSETPTPPANPDILFRTTIAPILDAPLGRVPVHVDPLQDIYVPQGHHVFVAFELAGEFPAVNCLMIDAADPDTTETEFWGASTEAPFSWDGLDGYGIPDKPVVSINGFWYLY